MKKFGMLNSEITKVISELGHTDQIVIADAGLPIPPGVKRIDLALVPGLPSFLVTLETILAEMQVEKVVYAEEMAEKNPKLKQEMSGMLEGMESETVTHEQFKQLTRHAKAVIRTGECTPYANIILQAGVIF
ncbi:D-ribose pyranase [Brevibacillus fulvus]|uniref:D-ribose pyranase n=1 Tax=Brevibacillus fulvus TaxID=1125967 RepID=A0A939BSS8_9BACL|nr:D-ribose pyranase [Brevibacillus fulvus]MBM7588814.1 D-ribose pyranase [Brevibacillus fulvus]